MQRRNRPVPRFPRSSAAPATCNWALPRPALRHRPEAWAVRAGKEEIERPFALASFPPGGLRPAPPTTPPIPARHAPGKTKPSTDRIISRSKGESRLPPPKKLFAFHADLLFQLIQE